MNDYKIVEVVEQEGTFDGKYKLSFDPSLLIKIVNHMAAEDEADVEEMENPKRLAVRVTIETREL